MIPDREIDPEDSIYVHLGDAFEHEAALMDDAYLRQHCEEVDAQGEARDKLRKLLREWDELQHPSSGAGWAGRRWAAMEQIIEAAREIVR